ncbi:MAG: ATP-binding protein [Isosphaeraceae bacterium]|nr:MAG: ATP-binding protein [Isosphaeraceae bacterium]
MDRSGLLIAKGETELRLLPGMANRHGLITGATGTGKTVTLHTIAEQFSRIGVPVFLADVKGDLAGLGLPGDASHSKIAARRSQLGLDGEPYRPCPVRFWDVYGEQGHPMRATITEMGPLLLSRILDLNDTQTGVLSIAFRVADDEGLLLLDLKDLRAMIQAVGEHARTLKTAYGNVSAASVGAIQRALLRLEDQGGEHLFGEPSLRLDDLMQRDEQGQGVVNILAADRLIHAPQVYASFLLWLLSELFETMPEVGDPEKPRLVFFFDEAHLLFSTAPKALLDRVEQVVRLIRSKGIGVYFVTQSPLDLPDVILGQMGHRVQHALRAFTPRDQKAVRAAAETFRANPGLDTATAITELGVGEALVSFLDEKGMPRPVERALIVPPASRVGPITPAQRGSILASSPLFGHYERQLDRESAYEVLRARAEQSAAAAEAARRDQELAAYQEEQRRQRERREAELDRALRKIEPKESRAGTRRRTSGGDFLDSFAKSAGRSAGTTLGHILRGVLGGLTGSSRTRRR